MYLCLVAVHDTNLFVVFVCRHRPLLDFSPRCQRFDPSDAGCFPGADVALQRISCFCVLCGLIVFEIELFVIPLRRPAAPNACFFVVLRVLLVFLRVSTAGRSFCVWLRAVLVSTVSAVLLWTLQITIFRVCCGLLFRRCTLSSVVLRFVICEVAIFAAIMLSWLLRVYVIDPDSRYHAVMLFDAETYVISLRADFTQ